MSPGALPWAGRALPCRPANLASTAGMPMTVHPTAGTMVTGTTSRAWPTLRLEWSTRRRPSSTPLGRLSTRRAPSITHRRSRTRIRIFPTTAGAAGRTDRGKRQSSAAITNAIDGSRVIVGHHERAIGGDQHIGGPPPDILVRIVEPALGEGLV